MSRYHFINIGQSNSHGSKMRNDKSIIKTPNNSEGVESKKLKILDDFARIESEIITRSSELTRIKLQLAFTK